MNNPIEQTKSTREEAMMWWISLRNSKKVTLAKRHFLGHNYYMLTGHEIESIWITEDK